MLINGRDPGGTAAVTLGSEKADDAVFTPATSTVIPFGALADETAPDSVDEGDIGAVRMTLDRQLRVAASSPIGDVVQPTVTVDTAAYVSGDCVGGIITMASFVDRTGGAARIDSLTISECGATAQAPAITVLLFKATPAGGTYTDNAALVLDASDAADLVAVVDVAAADYKVVGGIRSVTFGDLGIVVECAATSLFMLIQVNAGYDAVAATDFKVAIGYEKK